MQLTTYTYNRLIQLTYNTCNSHSTQHSPTAHTTHATQRNIHVPTTQHTHTIHSYNTYKKCNSRTTQHALTTHNTYTTHNTCNSQTHVQHTHTTHNTHTTYTQYMQLIYNIHIHTTHNIHTTYKTYNSQIRVQHTHTTHNKYTINTTQHNMHIQHTYNPCNSHTTQHTHTTHSYNTHCIDSKYEIENSTRTVSKVWWVFSRRSSNIQTGTMSSFSAAVQIQAFLSSALWIIIIQHKPIFHFTPTLVWGDTHSLICRALLQLLHTEPGLERGWWGYRHGKLKRNWQVEKDRPKSKEKCWTLSTNSSHDRWHSGYWKFIERDIAPKKKFSPKVMEDSQQTPAPNTPSAEGLWVKKKVRRK